MGFRIAKVFLTSGDFQRSKFKVKSKKTLKLNILKTVRDREKMSIEVI